jgi:hypothetical protein
LYQTKPKAAEAFRKDFPIQFGSVLPRWNDTAIAAAGIRGRKHLATCQFKTSGTFATKTTPRKNESAVSSVDSPSPDLTGTRLEFQIWDDPQFISNPSPLRIA